MPKFAKRKKEKKRKGRRRKISVGEFGVMDINDHEQMVTNFEESYDVSIMIKKKKKKMEDPK